MECGSDVTVVSLDEVASCVIPMGTGRGNNPFGNGKRPSVGGCGESELNLPFLSPSYKFIIRDRNMCYRAYMYNK